MTLSFVYVTLVLWFGIKLYNLNVLDFCELQQLVPDIGDLQSIIVFLMIYKENHDPVTHPGVTYGGGPGHVDFYAQQRFQYL